MKREPLVSSLKTDTCMQYKYFRKLILSKKVTKSKKTREENTFEKEQENQNVRNSGRTNTGSALAHNQCQPAGSEVTLEGTCNKYSVHGRSDQKGREAPSLKSGEQQANPKQPKITREREKGSATLLRPDRPARTRKNRHNFVALVFLLSDACPSIAAAWMRILGRWRKEHNKVTHTTTKIWACSSSSSP